jgi:hypothetical protein
LPRSADSQRTKAQQVLYLGGLQIVRGVRMQRRTPEGALERNRLSALAPVPFFDLCSAA